MDNTELNQLSNEELWQLFPIILSEYQSIWEEKYLSEEKELTEIIDKETVYRIRHIGSTAVPGLLAKPTIDILMEIYENTDTDRLIQLLEGVGYIYSPQPGNPPPHILLMKGYTMEGFKGQAVHLHIRYPGDWDEPYFCDYLKNNPDIAEEYGRLKVSLQVKFRNNRDGYTAAKTDFIRKYTALARAEQ